MGLNVFWLLLRRRRPYPRRLYRHRLHPRLPQRRRRRLVHAAEATVARCCPIHRVPATGMKTRNVCLTQPLVKENVPACVVSRTDTQGTRPNKRAKSMLETCGRKEPMILRDACDAGIAIFTAAVTFPTKKTAAPLPVLTAFPCSDSYRLIKNATIQARAGHMGRVCSAYQIVF